MIQMPNVVTSLSDVTRIIAAKRIAKRLNSGLVRHQLDCCP